MVTFHVGRSFTKILMIIRTNVDGIWWGGVFDYLCFDCLMFVCGDQLFLFQVFGGHTEV